MESVFDAALVACEEETPLAVWIWIVGDLFPIRDSVSDNSPGFGDIPVVARIRFADMCPEWTDTGSYASEGEFVIEFAISRFGISGIGVLGGISVWEYANGCTCQES